MATLTRRADWPERLAAFIERRRRARFRWGRHDCVLFAADAIEQMTGVDPIVSLRGRWRSRAEALAILEAEGGMLMAIDQRLPVLESVAMAQRGDLVAIPSAGAIVLGICVGSQAVAPGATGLRFAEVATALAAWRV